MSEDYGNGTLYAIAQNYSYSAESGISAMALSPNARFLYSADFSGDAIWTHSVDEDYGTLSYLDRAALPVGSAPSALVMHPMGQYLFAVLQWSSELVAIKLGWYSGLPTTNTTTYSLLPDRMPHTLNLLKRQLM